MLVLIGSGALTHHTTGFRKPSDKDLLGTYEDVQEHIKYVSKVEKIKCNYPADSGKKIIVKTTEHIREYEVAWPGTDSEALLRIIKEDPRSFVSDYEYGLCIVPPLDILLMIKESHKYKKDSIFFDKTRKDILLMRKLGAKIPPQYMEWFKWREKETYQNTLPKLNQSKKDFFNASVPYTYDHDSVHLAIKFLDKPAYQYFKPEENEVKVSKKLFFELPRQIQLLSVVEEAMTLAIERALVPFPNGMNPKQAFDYALSKCCTSIASGFWREFAYDNYDSVQELYDPTYFERFKVALANGVVKLYNNT